MGAATKTSRQCSTARAPRAPPAAQGRPGQRGDRALAAEHALGRRLGRGGRLQAVAGGEVDRLQHGVHGPPDGRAVTALVPRRRVEVDACLGQTGVVAGMGASWLSWPPREVAAIGAGAGRARGEQRVVVGSPARRDRPVAAPAVRRPLPLAARARARRRGSAALPPRPSGSTAPGDRARPQPATSSASVAPAAAARLRWTRHDEVVTRPRAGDVEEPPPLVLVELVVEGAGRLVVPRDECCCPAGTGARRAVQSTSTPRRPPWGWVVSPATITIGNSRPLAAWMVMMRTASWSGLGQHGLGDPDAVGGLAVGPRQVVAQGAATGLPPHPGLVDEVAQPAPHVRALAARARRPPGPAGRGSGDRAARRARPVPVGGQGLEVGDGVVDRVVAGLGRGKRRARGSSAHPAPCASGAARGRCSRTAGSAAW